MRTLCDTNIINLNLISVHSWTHLNTEVKVTWKWPISVTEKTPCISLDCKLVPVLYREYENGPFRTDSSAEKSIQLPFWISFKTFMKERKLPRAKLLESIVRTDLSVMSYLSKNKLFVPQWCLQDSNYITTRMNLSLYFTERAARWTWETYRRWIIQTAWVYQPQNALS